MQNRHSIFGGEKMRRTLVIFCAVGLVAGLIATAPAGATIEKIMNQCNGKLCPFFRASIVIPDGWIEDRVATRYFNSQFLLPKGIEFERAAAKIYVAVKYNRKKQPISDFMPENIADWHSRAKDAKITDLDDLPRGDGKVVFVRHQFEAGSLHEQGYELQAVTTDSDDDGNEFLVTITLSANSQKDLKAAEPAYLAILGKY
jgi:hypothetical protein